MLKTLLCFSLVAFVLHSACAQVDHRENMDTAAEKGTSKATAQAVPANPLLPKWSGPYGGVPPLDVVKVEHFKPALEASMKENLDEVDAIASNPAKPDFENTIAALERAGRTFARVLS